MLSNCGIPSQISKTMSQISAHGRGRHRCFRPTTWLMRLLSIAGIWNEGASTCIAVLAARRFADCAYLGEYRFQPPPKKHFTTRPETSTIQSLQAPSLTMKRKHWRSGQHRTNLDQSAALSCLNVWTSRETHWPLHHQRKLQATSRINRKVLSGFLLRLAP